VLRRPLKRACPIRPNMNGRSRGMGGCLVVSVAQGAPQCSVQRSRAALARPCARVAVRSEVCRSFVRSATAWAAWVMSGRGAGVHRVAGGVSVRTAREAHRLRASVCVCRVGVRASTHACACACTAMGDANAFWGSSGYVHGVVRPWWWTSLSATEGEWQGKGIGASACAARAKLALYQREGTRSPLLLILSIGQGGSAGCFTHLYMKLGPPVKPNRMKPFSYRMRWVTHTHTQERDAALMEEAVDLTK
jgi:hypothetical protein